LRCASVAAASRHAGPAHPWRSRRDRTGAGAEGGKGGRVLARVAGRDVDVICPQDATKVGLVASRRPEVPDGRLVEPEGLEKLEGKLLPIEGFLGQLGNGLFNFYGIHGSFQGLITRSP
jgi:hypothetical protein